MSARENYMSNDELADGFKSLFDQLHANIEAHEDGALKARAEELANIAHRALDRLQKLAKQAGVIQPFSGGDADKPD
jgi:phosphoenolpyruvate-protein kinase (PTS system EI component)